MSKANEDPFYAVKEDVSKQVERIKVRFDQFKDLVKSVDTSTNVEFKELRKGKDLRKVERDLNGLKGAVDQIEKNRAKFEHVRDQELALRRKFVNDSQVAINAVKDGMDSPAVRRKIDDDELRRHNVGSELNSVTSNPVVSSLESDNSAFIGKHNQRSHVMLKQQDDQLLELGSAVDRLGNMAGSINDELKDQNRMLNKLDDDLDDAGNKMNFVQAQLSKLLKTKDSCQIWTIVILTLILVILIALTIWT